MFHLITIFWIAEVLHLHYKCFMIGFTLVMNNLVNISLMRLEYSNILMYTENFALLLLYIYIFITRLQHICYKFMYMYIHIFMTYKFHVTLLYGNYFSFENFSFIFFCIFYSYCYVFIHILFFILLKIT